jgi:hypothetical protein
MQKPKNIDVCTSEARAKRLEAGGKNGAEDPFEAHNHKKLKTRWQPQRKTKSPYKTNFLRGKRESLARKLLNLPNYIFTLLGEIME